ncbi:MAG: VOC family protein [Bdellovibrionales bacterium]|jgi:hypothetical protein|nr:VOC family protein [Bdellovibrionales bacterium]
MIKALSHLVISSNNVTMISGFFKDAFNIEPHYINEDFSDFILPDKSRVAFFKPVGKAANFFKVLNDPSHTSYGITVDNVDSFYERVLTLKEKYQFEVSGKPKDHPWGEKSFLLIDPDRNRWEITQSPNEEGYL